MLIVKIILILILWIIIGCCLTYLSLLSLSKYNIKKLLYLNKKYKYFKYFFILYIMISPLIFINIIPVGIFVLLNDLLLGKDFLNINISETILSIAKTKGYTFKSYKTQDEKDEEFFDNLYESDNLNQNEEFVKKRNSSRKSISKKILEKINNSSKKSPS